MVEIPESLLRRSAEAKAKALGVPVEQVLAEMKGEGPPVEVPRRPPEEAPEEGDSGGASMPEGSPPPVEETPPAGDAPEEAPDVVSGAEQHVPPDEAPEVVSDAEQHVPPDEPKEAESPPPDGSTAEMVDEAGAVAIATEGAVEAEAETEETEETEEAEVDTGTPEGPDTTSPNGSGNGKVASVVSPRPSVPPAGLPEGVRTQRLLTVVKARAIQNVKAEPADKVNTWPHLMLMEFGALLAITGFLVILSVIIHSPLLDPANFNATPNPSKAPWYFLGLQELLSYFDPQIAGVTVPTIVGLIGFMFIPYVDKNPSTRPTDRKFAIMLYSIFLAGSATLTILGVLFRGQGFNFSYPWQDGVFFDDLKDWVHFE